MSPSLALDFGTGTTRVAQFPGTILLEEPTAAAVDLDTGALLAFGKDAIGPAAPRGARIRFVRPVRAGQLVDLDLAEEVLSQTLRRCGVSRLGRARLVVCTHSNATNVQKRALQKALKHSGVRDVTFVDGAIACALALGLPIAEPRGQMLIDIGAGVTDCAVLALGGVVASVALAIGGEDFDEAVRDHVLRHDGVLLETDVASDLRLHAGSIARHGDHERLEVLGRDASSGAPRRVVVERSELVRVLRSASAPIVRGALTCLTAAPPELANDLLETGVRLTGGGSGLTGLDRVLADALGAPVHVAEDASRLAVLGATRVIESGELKALSA